jgi:hypothetical protein
MAGRLVSSMQLPEDIATAPDVRTVEVRREVERCARVLKWVEALPRDELISSARPTIADDLISVVIPMYRARPWIESCLKSVLAQTHRNMEIFCVDDCSDDETYEHVVERFGHDGRICVVRLARNVGPFQISNWVGGVLARGPRLAFQDADNVSHPLRFAAQRAWMAEHGYRISGTCAHHFFPAHIRPFHKEHPPVEADGRLHELVMQVSAIRAYPAEHRQYRNEDWTRAWDRNEVGAADLSERGRDVPLAFGYRSPSISLHGSQMMDTQLFRDYGGYPGRTKLGEDSGLDWRLLRFHDIGNLPRVMSSRRSHDESLTRAPATGMKSPARLLYHARMSEKFDDVRRALADGDVARAQQLCTETMHCADIEIERSHCPFDIALS